MSLLILVVDDEPDVEVLFRQHFRRDLRAGRFTMEFAQSGPAALQLISDAADVSLILILSDINMPEMSGLELLPKARALRPDVPVIMITAYGDAETKRKALQNGAEALLTKPIDFTTLRNEIDLRVECANSPFAVEAVEIYAHAPIVSDWHIGDVGRCQIFLNSLPSLPMCYSSTLDAMS